MASVVVCYSIVLCWMVAVPYCVITSSLIKSDPEPLQFISWYLSPNSTVRYVVVPTVTCFYSYEFSAKIVFAFLFSSSALYVKLDHRKTGRCQNWKFYRKFNEAALQLYATNQIEKPVLFSICSAVISDNIVVPVAGRIVLICAVPQAGRCGS